MSREKLRIKEEPRRNSRWVRKQVIVIRFLYDGAKKIATHLF